MASLSGHAFGTSWRLLADTGQPLERLGREIERVFAEVDTVFSPWRPDSVISRFNAEKAGSVQHAALSEVSSRALNLARKSEGAFDPTVGPLVARWGFGPITGGGQPDWHGLSTGAGAIAKARDDVTLDLCGIAKGWALDRAGALATAFGLSDFLFELGGELIAQGQHPTGRDWRLSVEAPAPAPALRLPGGAAVATSGVWRQSYHLNGRLYSHIIDTRTDEPLSGALRSVTVVAAEATIADGWATALCAAGAEAGPDLAATEDLAALFLVESPSGLRQIETGPIRDFLL
tara:strand:+ start:4739 stop:5608 length:870 start_codon:yes stop_codon:yes gene_type:complete